MSIRTSGRSRILPGMPTCEGERQGDAAPRESQNRIESIIRVALAHSRSDQRIDRGRDMLRQIEPNGHDFSKVWRES